MWSKLGADPGREPSGRASEPAAPGESWASWWEVELKRWWWAFWDEQHRRARSRAGFPAGMTRFLPQKTPAIELLKKICSLTNFVPFMNVMEFCYSTMWCSYTSCFSCFNSETRPTRPWNQTAPTCRYTAAAAVYTSCPPTRRDITNHNTDNTIRLWQSPLRQTMKTLSLWSDPFAGFLYFHQTRYVERDNLHKWRPLLWCLKPEHNQRN